MVNNANACLNAIAGGYLPVVSAVHKLLCNQQGGGSIIMRLCLVLLVLSALIVGCGSALAYNYAGEDELTGTVIGRTGELLDIKLTQPVHDGTVFEIKSILSDPAIAEARVESCTSEWPYIALARIVRADVSTSIPIGAKVFTGVDSVAPTYYPAPKPMNVRSGSSDDQRFSLQAGTFYPRIPNMRITAGEFWQEYRFNYTFLRLATFELTGSGAYVRGSGDSPTTGGVRLRTTELIPATLFARMRLVRMGSTTIVLGGGAGLCRISDRNTTPDSDIITNQNKFCREVCGALESARGWVVELRYRDIPDTDIQGFSLALGGRF